MFRGFNRYELRLDYLEGNLTPVGEEMGPFSPGCAGPLFQFSNPSTGRLSVELPVFLLARPMTVPVQMSDGVGQFQCQVIRLDSRRLILA